MIISFKPGLDEAYKKAWYKKHGLTYPEPVKDEDAAPGGEAGGLEKASPKSDKKTTKKGRKGGK